MIRYTHYRDFEGYSNWIVASRFILERAKILLSEKGELIEEGCYRLNGNTIEIQEPTRITFDKAWSLKIPKKSLEKIAKKLDLPLEQK